MKQDKTKIGIIGLGYVGLPLGVAFCEAGFSVTGFELDPDKIAAINKGRSYISDVPTSAVKKWVGDKKLAATGNVRLLTKQDVVIICVPTPLRKTKDPDISYIMDAVTKIKANFKSGQLIILESTTYPGTTREVLLPILSEKGKKVGRDFWLAFSPERVDPGNAKYTIQNTPKVVGGITEKCSRLAADLYRHVVNQVVPVSSPEAAEMVKLLENTFRAVNIGLVNEVALMCDRMKIDTWEVIDAAATKPFGFMPFYPGPGLGGHCIPLDPHYLSWKLKTLNFYARFIELAGEINSKMPEHVVTKLTDALNERGKSLKQSKILVLGVAYKKDIGDVRESPALDVLAQLMQKQSRVEYHDPYVASLRIGTRRLRSVPLNLKRIKSYDCVLIITPHSVFPVKKIARLAKFVFDTRNATGSGRRANVVKL